MRRCHHCGAEWDRRREPGFKERCERCDAYLRCCLNCRLYNPHASEQCRSSTTEPVRDKDRPSFCEEFEFADRAADEADQRQKRSDVAREKFDRLFGDP